MFDWLRSKDATVAELTEQHAQAEQALTDARTAVLSAQQTFDETGSDAAAKGLAKAREAESFAAEHVGRARRLLTAGQAKAEAERRAALEAEAAQLRGELDHRGVMQQVAPLLQRQIAALEGVVAIRREHIALTDRLGTRVSRLQTVLSELGGPDREQTAETQSAWDRARLPVNPAVLKNAVEKRIGEISDPQARLLLRELLPILDFPGMPGSFPYRRQ